MQEYFPRSELRHLRLRLRLHLISPMVSAAVEAALHPKAEGAPDARESCAVESMAHSLTGSRKVMAALAPLAPPADFDDPVNGPAVALPPAKDGNKEHSTETLQQVI